MDDELAEFIKGAPPGRRVKKLERYAKLVLGSYDLGWTYRAIASQLRRKHRLTVAASTVWEFIRQYRPGAAPAPNIAIHLPVATVTEPKPSSVPVISQPQPSAPAKTTQPTPTTPPSPKAISRKPRFNLDT